MNGIIVYKGKYGATQQYAQWLAEELNLPAVNAEELQSDDLLHCDYIIIGTSVYIGKLQISKWLSRNLPVIRNKKIFFFQVAATPPEEKEKRQAYNQSGIPEAIINDCQFYFLPGRMIMQKLSWKDRFMLKIGARLTTDPAAKKTMLTDYNQVKKENITGLVHAVKKFYTNAKVTMQPV